MEEKWPQTGTHKIRKLLSEIESEIPSGEEIPEKVLSAALTTLYSVDAAEAAMHFFDGYHAASKARVFSGMQRLFVNTDSDRFLARAEQGALSTADDLTLEWARISNTLIELEQQLPKEHYKTIMHLINDTADAFNNTLISHIAIKFPEAALELEKEAIKRSTRAAGKKSAETRGQKKREGQAWYKENRDRFRTKSEAAMEIKERFNVAFDTALNWIKGI